MMREMQRLEDCAVGTLMTGAGIPLRLGPRFHYNREPFPAPDNDQTLAQGVQVLGQPTGLRAGAISSPQG